MGLREFLGLDAPLTLLLSLLQGRQRAASMASGIVDVMASKVYSMYTWASKVPRKRALIPKTKVHGLLFWVLWGSRYGAFLRLRSDWGLPLKLWRLIPKLDERCELSSPSLQP